jgi:hypothetical protein
MVADDENCGSVDEFTAQATFPGGMQVDVTNASGWQLDGGEANSYPSLGGGVIQTCEEQDGNHTVTASFEGVSGTANMDVIPGLVITTVSLPDATVGAAYDQTVQASGGTMPYTWSIALGSLPNGLSLDPSTGEITGTPNSTGLSSFTVQVTDSSSPMETYNQNLSIQVDPSS